MKKIAVFFLLLFLCAFTLLSCGGKSDIVTVKDGYGISYFVKRDEKGFITVDEKGRMKVLPDQTTATGDTTKKADENGTVDFPYFVTDGKRAECYEFYLDIPEGWTLSGTQTMKLTDSQNKADMSFTLRTKDSVSGCIAEIKDLYKDWNPMWDEKDIDLSFAKAKYLSSISILPNSVKSFYVFTVKDNTYVVQTTSFGKPEEAAGFEDILKTVKFR